jgi:hypothetical protein
MIPNESGNVAPPTPWIARPAISTSIDWDSAAISDPRPNVVRVTTSIRSLPSMSPRRPMIGVAIEAVSR